MFTWNLKLLETTENPAAQFIWIWRWFWPPDVWAWSRDCSQEFGVALSNLFPYPVFLSICSHSCVPFTQRPRTVPSSTNWRLLILSQPSVFLFHWQVSVLSGHLLQGRAGSCVIFLSCLCSLRLLKPNSSSSLEEKLLTVLSLFDKVSTTTATVSTVVCMFFEWDGGGWGCAFLLCPQQHGTVWGSTVPWCKAV